MLRIINRYIRRVPSRFLLKNIKSYKLLGKCSYSLSTSKVYMNIETMNVETKDIETMNIEKMNPDIKESILNDNENELIKSKIGIILDYYQSENIIITFLEMESNFPNRKLKIFEALTALKLHDSQFDPIDFNNFENDIQDFLEGLKDNTLDDIRKFLVMKKQSSMSNIEFKSLILDDPILGPIALKYERINQFFIKYIIDESYSIFKHKSFTNVGHICRILSNFNIINIRLWSVICQNVFLYPEKFEINNDLSYVLQKVIKLTKRFHYSESYDVGIARYHFIFNEKEMKSLLEKRLISRFLNKFYTFFVVNQENKTYDKNFLCYILNLFCEIVRKYHKVAHVDNYEDRKILKNIEKVILDNLEDLLPMNALSIFSNYVMMGINNDELVKKFTNYLQDHILEIDRVFYFLAVIKAWKYNGKYEENIYRSQIRELLLEYLLNPNELSKIPALAYDLVLIKLDDNEVWKHVLDRLNDIGYEKLYFFQKKSIHIVFQNLKFEKFVKIDLKPYFKLMNQLTKFCIGIKFDYDFNNIDFSNIEDGSLIECCNHQTIKLYQQAFEKILPEISDTMKKKSHLRDQNYPQTPQEDLISTSLNLHLGKILNKKVKLISEYGHCLYKIDFLIDIEGIKQKIAFEISGFCYTFENGELLGKKKIKINLLENYDLIPVFLDLGVPSIQNLLGIAQQNENIKFKLVEKIAELMHKELIKKHNINLGYGTKQKWMKKDSKLFEIGPPKPKQKLFSQDLES